jgi:hypothetical protein
MFLIYRQVKMDEYIDIFIQNLNTDMKIKEITESLADYKAACGQASAIPGRGPQNPVEKKKRSAKSAVEILVKK